MRSAALVLVALATAAPAAAQSVASPAQERPQLRLTRLTSDVRVDGRLDEPAWAAVPVATDFVQQEPDEGDPASQRTTVRLGHDGRALYIGARMDDDDADGIIARLARRDESVLSDWFTVYLDSYRDRRSAFAFAVNAAGVQRDLRLSDDTRRDVSWDAVWESAVTVDADGWTVELRIPLSQLRFDPAADAVWGLNFQRTIARRNEEAYWSPVEQGNARFVSRFGELTGTAALEPARRIEVAPYSAIGVTRDQGAAGNPFRATVQPSTSMGVDLRAGLGGGFTLAATVNPDFGQIEGDPAVVNLSAFEIFQMERRPFFVEGSDVFDLAMPGWPPLFYSRRIGRSPQASVPREAVEWDAPRASTILGAGKVTGRTGDWTLGALQAVTGEERARYRIEDGTDAWAVVEPLTSHSVARVARQFRDGRSGLGVLGTAVHRDLSEERLRFLHSRAYAFAMDGWHRFAEDSWELRGSVIGSRVRGTADAIARTQRSPGHYFHRPDADHLELDPDRTDLSGAMATARLRRMVGSWRGGLFFEAISPGYEVADLGFNPRLDHIGTSAWVNYLDFTPGSRVRSWQAHGAMGYETTFGGERKELTQTANLSVELLNYWAGHVWLMRHADGWDTSELRGGPALRKPGIWMGSFRLVSDRRRSLRSTGFLFWSIEDQGGTAQLRGMVDVSVRPSDRLDLSTGLSYTDAVDGWRYVGRETLGQVGDPLYMVGRLDRRVAALTGRLDYTLSPSLSLQLYARPYLSAGRYTQLRALVDPAARDFHDRFRTFGDDETEIALNDAGRRVFRIDLDDDQVPDLARTAPDYNLRSFQLNAVARWEYRPGSTLFVVWSHDRGDRAFGPPDLGGDLDALSRVSGPHTVMIKATYWLGL